METEDPLKKNNDISEEQNELDSSQEKDISSDQAESYETSDMSDDLSMQPENLDANQEASEESMPEAESDEIAVDVPETETDVVDSSLSEPPKKPMPKWLKNGLIIFGAALVLLLAGYLIAYFTSTIPKQNLYQTTIDQLQDTKSQLDDLNEKYDQLNNDFSDLNDENESLKEDYQSLNQAYDELSKSSEFYRNLFSLKYEVANTRYYLLKVDRISSRQAINLAIGYFDEIKDDLEPDISSGIADRLETIQKAINTKPDDALDELGTLFENLERIPLD